MATRLEESGVPFIRSEYAAMKLIEGSREFREEIKDHVKNTVLSQHLRS